MAHLSLAAKEEIILKAINRGTTPLESIARNNNIGLSTLQRWIRRYRNNDIITNKTGLDKSIEFNPEQKFNHILATSKLDELSLGKYCREHGLYSHQVTKWREDFMKPKQEVNNAKRQSELRKLKAENNKLQLELRRKDKALAEASALLVMKKKADLIWGESEED